MRDTAIASTAASLAFTTLLGLVPLATVALTFVARFPAFQQWLDALEPFLLSTCCRAAPTWSYTLSAIHRKRRPSLTGISIAFIVITATLLIATVEREINAIWGIARARPLARRLVLYALGTTVGPVLVGASISASTWLITESLAAVPLLRMRSPASW